MAIAAAFIRRWNLPLLSAILLALGAAGAVVAVGTGEREGELVGESAGTILDEHEDWAARTRTVALVAAALAIGAVATGRLPKTSRALGACAAVVAVGAAWCVAETGHRGGQLVYRHGAGVMLTASANPTESPAMAGPRSGKHERDGDKD